jgi:hypothetical protein
VYPTPEDSRFDRDTIWRLYVSSGNAAVNNKLTLKSGTLELIDRAATYDAMGNQTGGASGGSFIVGRGGTTTGIQGWLVQEGGSLISNEVAMDVGHFQNNVGNGFYEYKGGILEVSLVSDGGIRLGHGGSSGPAGNGTFIVHNSDQPGYIRAWNFAVGSGLGATGSSSNGSGTVIFNADFNGTRPIQVWNNLSLNHQDDTGVSGNKRSAVLKLALDEAPELMGGGVPINLGLFDIDSEEDSVGTVQGASDMFFTDTWDNGGLALPEGATISADFGSTRYNWTISYNGSITWVDKDTGELASITSDPFGDVVLIGLSSEPIVVEGLPGDYNGDDVVDAGDYSAWRNNFGGPGTALQNRDPLNSGNVNEADYTYWRRNYGNSAPGGGGLAGGQVPEPASFVLLALGILAAACPQRTYRQ